MVISPISPLTFIKLRRNAIYFKANKIKLSPTPASLYLALLKGHACMGGIYLRGGRIFTKIKRGKHFWALPKVLTETVLSLEVTLWMSEMEPA